jgi:hypothetical protein
MREFAEKFVVAFIPLFVAIDPIGWWPVSWGFAPNASREHRQRQGLLAVLTGFGVAIAFIFLGKIIFKALGITVSDFQVAGGLILLGIAVRDLLGFGESMGSGDQDFGVVPLGMPLIAGPALLTALLLLLDTGRYVLHHCVAGREPVAGRDRLSLCSTDRGAARQARPKRRLEADRASARRDRGQSDPPWLANAARNLEAARLQHHERAVVDRPRCLRLPLSCERSSFRAGVHDDALRLGAMISSISGSSAACRDTS